MFSKPFPAFSSRMNAWVTLIASQWLMGPSQLNDIEVSQTQSKNEKRNNNNNNNNQKAFWFVCTNLCVPPRRISRNQTPCSVISPSLRYKPSCFLLRSGLRFPPVLNNIQSRTPKKKHKH